MKPSQAIAMFYKQIVRQRGYPFELKVPNAETLDAFQEAKNPNNLSKYDTVTEGLDDVWESE
jgi:DNA-damage-inducible protein J